MSAEIHTPESDADRADRLSAARDAMLDALAMHVPFDGWSKPALDMAAADAGIDRSLVQAIFPRGGIDAAAAFHRRADARMAEAMEAAPLESMKIREKVAFAIRTRLELVEKDRESVRRAASLFALPMNAVEGGKLIWETADAIWKALGDESRDLNWYSKRATLSGVYSAVVLYWLQDETEDRAATWAFLDRRIEDVMRIEKAKGRMRASPLGKAADGLAGRLFSAVRAPGGDAGARRFGFPGPRRG